MMNQTFSRKISLSFALLCILSIIAAALGVYALTRVVDSKDRIENVNDHALMLASHLQTDTIRQSAEMRGGLLAPSAGFDASLNRATADAHNVVHELAGLVEDDEGKSRIAAIGRESDGFDERLQTIVAMRQRGESTANLTRYMVSNALPQRVQLDKEVEGFADYENRTTDAARAASTATAVHYRSVLLFWTVLVILLAGAMAWQLSRSLTGQIGGAVQEIHASAAQLQSTATEQATGAREQATAMTEITTTMTELLTTSRQIADSSQRVAEFSRESAEAARTGDGIVDRAQASLNDIRRQVDVIVEHMLDLGRKSQQIGGLVEVISELAEQTNILAINANIEAAGAGDAGRRFAVVADEIRKLADRVAGSARQTRGMVEEVRSAINTTVMATESGSKAVDAGTRDFDAVKQSLDQILALVSTATEAAREIELSTKQQSTAVEQVNLAVGNVAQVSRDVETSTTQASQTASQLARLSARMSSLIRDQHEQAANL
jgi:CHASE3 domain sensor protein